MIPLHYCQRCQRTVNAAVGTMVTVMLPTATTLLRVAVAAVTQCRTGNLRYVSPTRWQ